MKNIDVLIIEETASFAGAQYDTLLIQRTLTEAVRYKSILPEGKGAFIDKLKEERHEFFQVKYPFLLKTSFTYRNSSFFNPLSLPFNLFSMIYLVWRLKVEIKRMNIDLVVTNGMRAHFAGGIASRLIKKPVVFRLMDIIRPNLFFGLGRKIFNKLCKFCKAKIIVPSKSVRLAMFSKDFAKQNVSVIYNATDSDDFNCNDGVTQKQLVFWKEAGVVFGCFSRVVPWKGQKNFIYAAENLLSQGIKANFLIVGGPVFSSDTYFDELKSIVSNSRYQNHFCFTGFVDNVHDYLKIVDCVVVPSILPDPCPRVMVESMAMKKPLIGSDLGGIPEVIKHGVSGLIYKSDNIVDLGNQMSYLATNPEKMKEMGENGFNRQKSLYRLSEYQRLHELNFQDAIEKYSQ